MTGATARYSNGVSMVKVLLIDVSSRLGAVGGAQRVAANLLYELPKRGIETFYLGYETEYINKKSGNIFFLRNSKQKNIKKSFERHRLNKIIESRLFRIAYYSAYSILGINTVEIKQFIKNVNPDIIMASSIQDYIVLKSLRSYLGNAKLVYIEHANASGSYKGSFDYNILSLTFGTGSFVGLKAAQSRFFKFFDAIVALNKEQYNSVKKFNGNVTIIHSSSLLQNQKISEIKLENLKSKLNIGKSDKVILYLGRLAEAQKNVSTLILAFKGIPDKSMKLLIVGEGKSKPLYEEMASNDKRILFTGRVSEDMLAYYYSVADLYVLPSVWESFNATFIEAASFGIPLLLSLKAVNEDIINKFGKSLYLFEPKDLQGLKENIMGFFGSEELRERLKALSSQIAKEYSKENQMNAYAKMIKTLYEEGSVE